MSYNNKFEPVVFDTADNEKRSEQIKDFELNCNRIDFVIDALERHRRYSRGIGEYKWRGYAFPMPYCPTALTIIEDAAIRHLNEYAKAKNHYDEWVWMKLVCGNNPWE